MEIAFREFLAQNCALSSRKFEQFVLTETGGSLLCVERKKKKTRWNQRRKSLETFESFAHIPHFHIPHSERGNNVRDPLAVSQNGRGKKSSLCFIHFSLTGSGGSRNARRDWREMSRKVFDFLFFSVIKFE